MAAANTADGVSITSSIRIKTGISDVSKGKKTHEGGKSKPEISAVLVSSLCCSLVSRSFVSFLSFFLVLLCFFFQDFFHLTLFYLLCEDVFIS